MRRIVVPVDGDTVAAHLGEAHEFAFYDVDPEGGTVPQEVRLDAPPQEPTVLAGWIAERNAHVVLAQQVEPRAQELLAAHGINVIVGELPSEPGKAVEAYLRGDLPAPIPPSKERS
jgi:predicted Fe-Mo cluster-binding NifX family protein